MDTAGNLRIVWPDETRQVKLDLGSVRSIEENFSKSVSVTPLVSLKAENAVAVETGSAMNLGIKFSRVNSSEESAMDNATWYREWTSAMNRWQMKTDGFRLEYSPDSAAYDDGNPYVPEYNCNGYIKRLRRVYTAGKPTEIDGDLEFHVGTMYSGTKPVSSTTSGNLASDFAITITDSTRAKTYPLLSGNLGINCVKSYELKGGINHPFESLEIRVSHEKLYQIAPELIDNNDLQPGKNMIHVDAVGISSNMTVVKAKLKEDIYSITAYCTAEVLKSRTLDVDGSDTPAGWINYILTDPKFGVDGANGLYNEGSIVSNVSLWHQSTLTFAKGTNVWYILQVCSMISNTRIFFAEGKAYTIDYVNGNPGDGIRWDAYINLYPQNDDELVDEFGLFSSVVGDVVVGNEGMDAMANAVQIEHSAGSEVFRDTASIDTYKQEQTAGPIDLRGLSREDAETFANGFFNYRDEPQISVRVSVKELCKRYKDESESETDQIWVRKFPNVLAAYQVIDPVEHIAISNRSQITKTPKRQKLLLTSYNRRYPEGITDYSFGVISEINLANSTSKIVSAQSVYTK